MTATATSPAKHDAEVASAEQLELTIEQVIVKGQELKEYLTLATQSKDLQEKMLSRVDSLYNGIFSSYLLFEEYKEKSRVKEEERINNIYAALIPALLIPIILLLLGTLYRNKLLIIFGIGTFFILLFGIVENLPGVLKAFGL